jgi:hypothetical protein
MKDAAIERETLEPVTEEQVVRAGEQLISRYSSIFWLIDFEGVLLPKEFSTMQKKHNDSLREDDLAAIERGIYRLPVNTKLVSLLERLLKIDPNKSWLVEGSSLVTLPQAEQDRNIPVFRFGAQRAREIISNIADKTVGQEKSIKPNRTMPEGSLMIVINDEMPPIGLYKYIKGASSTTYDSCDIAEVPVPVYRGEKTSTFNQDILRTMLTSFRGPVVKRPVELSKSTRGWSTGAGLGSLGGGLGGRIRREGD